MVRYKTIKELREAAGMTQVELAAAIKVAPSTLAKWEQARQEPGVVAFRNLARVLKADMESIDLRPFEKTK